VCRRPAARSTVAADCCGLHRRPRRRPQLQRVCRHRTGHAEAVEAWFGLAQVSYAELLQTFWRIHSPTTRNRRGFDFGSQYRSAIFYHDAGQQEAAIASRDAEQQSLRRQIVTQITPASAFYWAEEYHQRYLEKQGHPGCAATIRSTGGSGDLGG
jgi:peptide-methionine (S)-S-oxide reductase